jgi:ABC-type multidrug transport system fused ATPase/permease subunit
VTYLSRVLKHLLPYRNLAIYSTLVTGLSALLTLGAPWPLKLLVDNVIQNARPPHVLSWLWSALGSNRVSLTIAIASAGFCLVIATGVFNVVSNYVNTKLQELMVLDLRSDLFQQAQRLSLALHDRKRSGRLIYTQ